MGRSIVLSVSFEASTYLILYTRLQLKEELDPQEFYKECPFFRDKLYTTVECQKTDMTFQPCSQACVPAMVLYLLVL